ncbi:MAG: MBL fold metallo-hydrolase [Variovorax sp.]|nr:MAG: MBL fold metallo-hydrolase [Variovorax sp.]
MSTGLPAGVTVFERGWLSSNNVLFVGRSDIALVDTGYVTHSEQTLALVESVLGDRPLDRVLNTHLHSDHCGGNAALQARYPALSIEIPPGEAAAVANWDEVALSYAATGQRCPRFRFDALLVPGNDCVLGDTVWEVHAAPGHDPHSIILFEPATRTLISADALWENGFGVAFPELAGEPSFGEIAATLDLIESLRPDRVIPGHGRMFFDGPGSLAVARRRLEGLARDPHKHALHAMKVLIKFKLLELQVTTRESINTWAKATPYLESIRARFFPTRNLQEMCDQLLGDLVNSKAALIDGDLIKNN